jgi:uncharacterized protein YjbJ (UPF0337 family)
MIIPTLIELEDVMSVDSLRDLAEQPVGRLDEAVGDLVSDRKMQAKGMLDEAVDAAEQVYGLANRTARGALNQAAGPARSARDEVEDFIGDRPVLAAGIALGVGIALGALLLGGGRAAYDRR